MNNQQSVINFIEKIRKEKGEAEAGEFLANLVKFSASEIYFTILENLTEEDIKEIEAISDDKEAEEEMKKRFKLRTGFTPEEFAIRLREEIVKHQSLQTKRD